MKSLVHYDQLDPAAQAAARERWSRDFGETIDGLDLRAEFEAAGIPYSEPVADDAQARAAPSMTSPMVATIPMATRWIAFWSLCAGSSDTAADRAGGRAHK